jgi:hypothetical protein
MKIKWIIAIVMLFSASFACADEVGEAFSGKAPEQIVKSTRHLIQSGLNRHDMIEVTRAMLENQFNAQQILDAHSILLNAHQQEVALAPIVSKAYEGISKRVVPDNIVKAMEKVRSRYVFAHRQAQKLTSGKSHVNQIEQAMTASLSAGMDSTGVETIVKELQTRFQELNTNQQVTLALETFKTARDMARLGVSSSQAVSVVTTALQHQFDNTQMNNMRAAFVKGSRTTAPQNLAASYAADIAKGNNFGDSNSGQSYNSKGSETGGSGGETGSGGSGGTGGSGPGGSGGGGGGSPGGGGGSGGSK